MYLKLFLFAFVVKCAVLASQEELNENQINDSIGVTIDSSVVGDLEIPVPLTESVENSETMLTTATFLPPGSSEITLNETEISANITEIVTEATTVLDSNNYDNDNSSYNATDSTGTDGENTVVPETVTFELTETEIVSTTAFTNESEVTSQEPEVTTPSSIDSSTNETETTSQEQEVTTSSTTVSSINETETTPQKPEVTTASIIDSSTNETETTSQEQETPSSTISPTTEIEVTSQVPETTIDPKYRNETFELYLEEFMRNNPSAVNITSPGFPAPYDNNLDVTFSVTLTNCTGIDVVVHYLDLNPFQQDSLYIRGGNENATKEIGRQLTGRKFNIRYTIIHTTSLFIRFKTGPFNDEYQGFVLTYAPFGDDTLQTTTTEAPVTIPEDDVQNFEVLLVLSAENRTNVTWQKFKDVLANSATKYVLEQNLHVEIAYSDNVTISIYECPHNWPNYKTCIRLKFSITLWNLDYDPEVDFDLTIYDYELSTISLSAMWDLYGKYDFLEVLGVEEYSPPDGTQILLLWTGVSLGIVVIFIGVLYSIWRLDIFREYRRMYTKNDDQQDILKDQSELDVSMYPTPHQPYPTLFETNEMNLAGYYDSNEMTSSSFHNFHHEMQQEKSSTSNNYRQATSHFSPNIMDLNDSPFFTLDDEEDIRTVPTLSPRSKQKLLVLGAKRDESTT